LTVESSRCGVVPSEEMYGGRTKAAGNDALISETCPSGFRRPMTNLTLQISSHP